MISAIDKSLSALNALGTKMNVTADNIANALTDEFKKSRVTFKEGDNGGVAAIVDRVDIPGGLEETIRNDQPGLVESSNVDLAEELTGMIPTRSAYAANLKSLKVQDEMTGYLLDIFS